MTKHIVLTPFGSLGDLHPMIALGIGLKERGYRVTLATSKAYQAKVETAQLHFAALRPEPDFNDKALYRRLFDPKNGPEMLIKDWILPYLEETYDDLKAVLQDADFLVNSPLVFPGPILAAELKLPWAAALLQPMGYMSTYDPPTFAPAPISEAWHDYPHWFWKAFMPFLKSITNPWVKPITRLRKQLNLPPSPGNPIFEGQFSPHLNLALFSTLLGKPQPDWPTNCHATGFCYYNEQPNQPLPEPLQQFLNAGEPSIIFTLGSSAVNTSEKFYPVSIEAIKQLQTELNQQKTLRALCLIGDNPLPEEIVRTLPKTIMLWDYAPYESLFPHAKAVVHQAGAGTTAQVLRAGKPMIIVPFAFDQPDNASRMKRLGVSQTIPRKHYTVNRLKTSLKNILQDPTYQLKAQQAAQQIAQENGVKTACNLIEQQFTQYDKSRHNHCVYSSTAGTV